MLLPLIILFTLVPVVELYLLIQVGQRIGALDTMALVFVTGVAGAYVARTQGRSILIEIQAKLQLGELPADSLLNGLFVFAGGLMLLTPGFITDILGFCMVLPFTRPIFIGFLKNYFAQKIKMGNVNFYTNIHTSQNSSSHQKAPERVLKDVEVIDVESKEEE